MKCTHIDSERYVDGRCKQCCREYSARWKKSNGWAVKLQVARHRKKKLLANRHSLEKRIAALRAEADYLEGLICGK